MDWKCQWQIHHRKKWSTGQTWRGGFCYGWQGVNIRDLLTRKKVALNIPPLCKGTFPIKGANEVGVEEGMLRSKRKSPWTKWKKKKKDNSIHNLLLIKKDLSNWTEVSLEYFLYYRVKLNCSKIKVVSTNFQTCLHSRGGSRKFRKSWCVAVVCHFHPSNNLV